MRNRYQKAWLATACLAAVLIMISCQSEPQVQTSTTTEPGIDLSGTWRANLNSPGGELPFFLEITPAGDGYEAVIINGPERLQVPHFEQSETSVRFGFPHYDSFISARLDGTANYMLGSWSRLSPGGDRTTMQFGATREQDFRFRPLDGTTEGNAAITPAEANVSGTWSAVFSSEGDDYIAQGEFSQDGTEVTGTFLTETGDYRFLAGSFEYGVLRLSVFDGAHAFIFKAIMQEDGSLEGDFWSRDSYHATWAAVPGEAPLGDAFELTSLKPGIDRFSFAFPDVDGEVVSSEDQRFQGKAMIVAIFGTWCPNCNDEVPILKDLYERYHEEGLEIVGLANEFAPDFEGKAERVQAFATRYDIPWPLLIVGNADKEETREAVKALESFTSYPTTLFINKDGSVRAIHTGFTGPGTGDDYQQLIAEFERLTREITGS